MSEDWKAHDSTSRSNQQTDSDSSRCLSCFDHCPTCAYFLRITDSDGELLCDEQSNGSIGHPGYSYPAVHNDGAT